jgi:signal transduction histidine kinase
MGETAHELRRPLGVARAFVEMLLEGKLGTVMDAQRTALLRVQSKLDEALHALTQELMVSRLEADALSPTMRELDLGQEAEAAVERAQARVELAGGTTSFQRPDAEITAVADRGLLAQVLDNLLDNAISYADGVPRIELQAGVAERPFVRVCDEGVGIDPDLRDQIFDQGFRAHPAGPRLGSGVGLHLSRRAAEAMGGELAVEWTQPGQGSCFRLQLRSADQGARPIEAR